jgi:hypothetical protein
MLLVYVLTLVFACRSECSPPTQTLPETYATRAECLAAGAKWVTAAANPTGTVRTYACAVKR